MNKFHITCLLGLGLAISTVACTSSVQVYQYQYDSRLDEVFIKQDVDFSKYRAVMIDQVSVWYPDEHAPTPENEEKVQTNLARAQDLFRTSFGDALGDNFPVTDKAGKDVLRVHVEFVDLRAVGEDDNIPADLSRYEFKTQAGHITMIAQLFDSMSGEQLARGADQGKQKSVGGEGRVDWDAIAADFEYWAVVFSAFMEDVHSQ